MTVDTLASVQTEFPRWYAQFQIVEDPALRQARLKSIVALAKKPTVAELEALIRMAFMSKRQPSADAAAKIRAAFSTNDYPFPIEGHEKELAVLSGACLVQTMEAGLVPALASLMVSTASLSGARSADLPFDLSARAEVCLRLRSQANRARPQLSAKFSELSELDFSVATAKATEQPDWSGTVAAIEALHSSLKAAFSERASDETARFALVENYLRIRDEELDMLWWLIGQRSLDLNIQFDALTGDHQPLVLAKELAQLTNTTPGPASIASLLSRAGVKQNKRIKLVDAITAVPADWALGFVSDQSDFSPVTMPVHFGIQRKLENGDGNAWIGNWSNVTGIDSEFQIDPLALALSFFRERLRVTLY